MLKLIIAGGRDFADYLLLKTKVLYFTQKWESVQIVCGGARGADSLGEKLAKEMNWNIQYFRADWDEYGKSAGYRRNKEMAEYANALVAFWDGKSKGTKHMIDLALAEGLSVRVLNYEGEVI